MIYSKKLFIFKARHQLPNVMTYFLEFEDFLQNNIIGGIIISIFSSFLFIYLLLWILRPKFIIADKICYQNDKEGNKFFFFKIVNKSMFSLYNVEIKLHERVPYIVDTAKVNHQMNIKKLSTEKIYCIPKFKKEKGYGEHAILIRTFNDISENINEKNLDYQLTVSGKHGLSNITRVVFQRFTNSRCLHDGDFKFGSKTDLV